MDNNDSAHITAVLIFLIFVSTSLAAFVTHVVWSINAAAETGSAIALLIIGVFIPPVGVVHGVAIWFGYSWI